MLTAIGHLNINTNSRSNKPHFTDREQQRDISFEANFAQIAKHLKPTKSGLSSKTKFFYMCSQCGGELETILFNGAGKALLAPLFIAFNPLSREKKEDKAYMAWKQPISAVVNMGAQLLILLKANKYLDKLAEKGFLGDLYKTNGLSGEMLQQNAKRLGVFKARASFALAMISMPLVCGIVNWLYPRFMETIFPNKAKSYSNKGAINYEC